MGSASLKSLCRLDINQAVSSYVQPSAPQWSNVASKLIELPVWRLGLHLPVQLTQLGPLRQLRCAHQARPNLQVGLPVQVGCFNIAHSLRLGGGEDDEVGREVVAILHLEDVAHLHLPPWFLNPLALPTEHSHLSIVHFSVTIMAFDVFDYLLDGDQCKDEEEGHNGDISACWGNPRDLLKQPNSQEEYVGIPGADGSLNGQNWKLLTHLLNCSKRNLGMKVMRLYLAVEILLLLNFSPCKTVEHVFSMKIGIIQHDVGE